MTESSSLLDALSSLLSNLFLYFLAGFLALVALAILAAIAIVALGAAVGGLLAASDCLGGGIGLATDGLFP